MKDYRDTREYCPEATRHDSDRSGHCRWCGRWCDLPVRRPKYDTYADTVTALDVAYGEFYDPDYWYDKPFGKHYDS